VRLNLRSKKGFLLVVSVVLSIVIVTGSFSQILGPAATRATPTSKQKMGYVDTQSTLLTYNLEGVQMEEVGDPMPIIDRVQADSEYTMLMDELAVLDADGGTIDPIFATLRDDLEAADPMVRTVTFDNDMLPTELSGGTTGVTPLAMISFSVRSINENDVHISVFYRSDLPPGDTDEEKIVMGVVTNNDASIQAAGLEHQVYHLRCILIKHGCPIHWHIWWYNSHHHPNWFYGWYYWYWRYYWYYHNIWYPWFTWWWGWYYWHYWYYWSTWWPYFP
jgi:hypothetical protein